MVRKIRRIIAVMTAAIMISAAFSQTFVYAAYSEDRYIAAGVSGFSYVHDPRLDPTAMADIVENPNAIYGFSPNPASTRLGVYASYDWTDPVVVSKARKERIEYLKQDEYLYHIMFSLKRSGASEETIARMVSTARNVLRLKASENDPLILAKVKQSNLNTYGDENGPTPEFLYKKYGSWEMVINKAFSMNSGMDACLGLYDDNYNLYLAFGKISPSEADKEKLKSWGENAPIEEIYYLHRDIYNNPNYFDQTTGKVIWPPNDGYWGEPFEFTFIPGMKLDRYGSDYGTYTSLYGDSYEKYSAAPDSEYKPYSVFVVTKPFTAKVGMVAPWFDQPGGATQVQLPSSVGDYINAGYLQRIEYR